MTRRESKKVGKPDLNHSNSAQYSSKYINIAKLSCDLTNIKKVSKAELNDLPIIENKDRENSYVRFSVRGMNICESKVAGYKTIAGYILGIALIYPLTMLVSSDFVIDELRHDRYFEDNEKFCEASLLEKFKSNLI